MSKAKFDAVKVAPSSNVQRVTYCADENRLRVLFKSGEYEYAGVPADIADAWSKAESSGKFFFASVRGKYDSHKLEAEPGPTFCSVCGGKLEGDELLAEDVPGHGGLHSYCGYG